MTRFRTGGGRTADLPYTITRSQVTITLMELAYVQIFLDEGGARAWSSLRGELDVFGKGWDTLFTSTAIRPVERQARVMIHLLGNFALMGETERQLLMGHAAKAGYGVARIIEDDPLLEPEEAFGLLLVPFT